MKTIIRKIVLTSIILIFSISAVNTVFSQSLSPVVLCSGGEQFYSGGYSLDFVLGELTTGTYIHPGTSLYEGFLQTDPDLTDIGEDYISADQLMIYPNPASDHTNIRMPVGFNADVLEIIDMQGRIRSSFNIHGTSNHRIDLDHLPAGIYLIRITTVSKEAISKRILKTY